ncbi:interleukin-27 subunit beta isoform X2 [Microtus pennsylvanicus]|uniref:interleukin-27 subunit beta isoform X2 n=1 Tax=Microtus pennsylvanicus TaxID=10058 RepID=UPI003F6AFD49
MSRRLLLSLALWASCSPGNAGTAALSQPRVRCHASRYPVAVDCSWTPLRAPNSTRPTSFIATYRLGVATQQQSQPCLQSTPEATCCTIPHVHLFSTMPYVLNVTALHPSGASSSLLAFVAERIREHHSALENEALEPTTVRRDLEDTALSEQPRHKPHSVGSRTGGSRDRSVGAEGRGGVERWLMGVELVLA